MRQGLSFRHERQTSAGLPLAKGGLLLIGGV